MPGALIGKKITRPGHALNHSATEAVQQRCVRLDYSNCFNTQTSHVSFLLFNTVLRRIYLGFVYFTTVGLLTYRYLAIGCLGPF